MSINGIAKKVDNVISKTNTKINEKWINSSNFKSIKNTNSILNFEKNKNATSSVLSTCNYIESCENVSDNKITEGSLYDPKKTNTLLDGVNNKVSDLSVLDELVSNLNGLFDNDKNANNTVSINGSVSRVENKTIEKKESINKLPDWITNSGRKELNTEQKLYFKSEKKRSFKNLVKNFSSPLKFINRSLLPIKIDFEKTKVNERLNDFSFGDISNNKDFNNFSNKLNKLNKTFVDNIDMVMNKKALSHKKIDIMIKYQALERSLECKLVNDIKILSHEFKTDIAKSKFQENYSDLPGKINSKLNSTFNSNIDELFSSNMVDELRDLLKEKINSQNNKINIHDVINKTINSVMSPENKNNMMTEFENDVESIKKELSFNLTKELFKNLSKDVDFIGEKNAIAKIEGLIKTVKDDVSKKMGNPTDKIINSLKDSFYENIKSNDNGEDLLTRLFKNSSNNIHYKWAQDAVLLLISYETFENKNDQISSTNYINNGVVKDGGKGSKKIQETKIETTLSGIFSRLGLSLKNLDASKDEVLRKYFANYFEHY
ncbi:hypothetical protein I5E97_09800 [Proteus hauseri]|uniref:hypothetical protein n=1 Tax=Proteus cibi TaxID=2050966 RepID=UPI000D6895D5|nr:MULTISPECIES: hypothetical protein [Proteus]MBG6031343.1 hypothetical protein [Proteus hauseri]